MQTHVHVSRSGLRHSRQFAFLVLTLSLLLTASFAWAVPLYRAIELSPLAGGWSTNPVDINNAGQIAGTCRNSQSLEVVARWDNPYAVPDEIGNHPDYDYQSSVYAMNSSGSIVGESYRPVHDTYVYSAFLWMDGFGFVDLGAGEGSRATGINDAGQVVGNFPTGLGYGHPFIWDATGGFRPVFTQAAGTASDINNNGEVVGYYRDLSGNNRAYVWTAQTGLTDLGVLPGAVSSSAVCVNDSGVIIGTSGNSAFVKMPGSSLLNLGMPAGVTRVSVADLSATNQIVGGLTYSTGPQGSRAFSWWQDTGIVDLNTLLSSPIASGYQLISARGVNDNGMIVAVARDASWNTKAYLLTAVPEPSSLLGLCLGLASMGAMLRRRR